MPAGCKELDDELLPDSTDDIRGEIELPDAANGEFTALHHPLDTEPAGSMVVQSAMSH
jgi:hypothetical protein